MTATCPSDAEFQRLLADQLSESEEAALEAHVVGCSTCQARLDQLTSGARTLPGSRVALEQASESMPPPASGPERDPHLLPAQVQLFFQPNPSENQNSPTRVRVAAPALAEVAVPIGSSGRWTSLSSLRTTGNFLRGQFWTWPLVVAVLLGAVCWWVHRSVDQSMRQGRINELNTVLDADVAALRVWMSNQRTLAELIAADDQLRSLILQLVSLADGTPRSQRRLLEAQAQAALRARLVNPLRLCGFTGFMVVSPEGLILAADTDEAVGQMLDGYRKEFLMQVARGQAAVSRPFPSQLQVADSDGQLRTNVPVMTAAASVLDRTGKPVAALGLRIRPEKEFTQILQVARFGKSGETYAFDRQGRFLSQSRFDDELKRIGLLADQPNSRSLLTLELRDPGVNMVAGRRPQLRRADQPLTRMADQAVQGHNGHDADGYRDYRGVPVVGAWRWLDEYGFGVATEVDIDEAFHPLYRSVVPSGFSCPC